MVFDVRRRNFLLFSVSGVARIAQAFDQTLDSADRVLNPSELEDAKNAALALLSTIDTVPLSAAALSGLYSKAGFALRHRYKTSDYDLRLRKVRGPLGSVNDRQFAGYSGPYSTMPNLPPGDYLIIGFKTEFSAFSGPYTEQVTLEKDSRGSNVWRFVEYYVAPIGKKE